VFHINIVALHTFYIFIKYPVMGNNLDRWHVYVCAKMMYVIVIVFT